MESAERLLQSRFHVFEHKESKRQLVRVEGSYFVPPHINELVEFVGGVHGFPSAGPSARR